MARQFPRGWVGGGGGPEICGYESFVSPGPRAERGSLGMRPEICGFESSLSPGPERTQRHLIANFLDKIWELQGGREVFRANLESNCYCNFIFLMFFYLFCWVGWGGTLVPNSVILLIESLYII